MKINGSFCIENIHRGIFRCFIICDYVSVAVHHCLLKCIFLTSTLDLNLFVSFLSYLYISQIIE